MPAQDSLRPSVLAGDPRARARESQRACVRRCCYWCKANDRERRSTSAAVASRDVVEFVLDTVRVSAWS